MPPSLKRLGILTGGGDCPGLNAVIRAVAKTAILQYGIEVVGIEDGFQGLIEHRVRQLHQKDVNGILTRGGTVLGSNNKANPTRYCVGRTETGEPIYRVTGVRPERWVRQTDFANEEAVGYLADRLAHLGVEEQLLAHGAAPGSTVVIGPGDDAVVFDWEPTIGAGGTSASGPRGTDRRL